MREHGAGGSSQEGGLNLQRSLLWEFSSSSVK